MSQARSSAVHLQIRLLLIFCLLLLSGLCVAKIYETRSITDLSEKVKSQAELIATLQKEQQRFKRGGATSSVPSVTEQDVNNALAEMKTEPGASSGLGGGNQLPSNLSDPDLDLNQNWRDLPPDPPSMGSLDNYQPPIPPSPIEQQEARIEEELSRKQHLGVVAAAEGKIVIIEPLNQDIYLTENDQVMVAREMEGKKKLIATLVVRSIKETEGETEIMYVADVATGTEPILVNDLIFQ